jgi:hypothetical protein
MKRTIFILLALYLLSVNSSGQWYNKYYPGRKISELNQSELQIIYEKADNLRKTGKGIYIGGVVVGGLGLSVVIFAGVIDLMALIGNGEGVVPAGVYDTCFGFVFVGLGIALVGIPLWITGATRIKEISKMPAFRIPNTRASIIPALQYNQVQNKFVPGLSLSFRF